MKTLNKTILIISAVSTILMSCTDNVNYTCTKGTIRVLNKNKYPCARGGMYCTFLFHLYDGKEAYWCSTDENTYSLYNVNDTLPTLVITKTIKTK